jgi:hypothetical protein
MDAAGASYEALLPNLVSVRIDYMLTAGSIGGLLDCVVSCDGPLACDMPLAYVYTYIYIC